MKYMKYMKCMHADTAQVCGSELVRALNPLYRGASAPRIYEIHKIYDLALWLIYEVYKIYDIAREYGSALFQEFALLFESASAPAWYEIHARHEIIINLFCKRALLKRRYSAIETYIFKEPTHRSHPIGVLRALDTYDRNKIIGLFCRI